MDIYLWWSGLTLNVLILFALSLVIYVWFIWPAVEAISMVRYYKAIAKKYPDVKLKSIFRLFISCYEPFGRNFEAVRCPYGEWRGIGKWRVYNHD